eukprot:gene80-107_t
MEHEPLAKSLAVFEKGPIKEEERMTFKKKLKEASLTDRRRKIDVKEKLSICHQCQILGLHRSEFYYQPSLKREADIEIMRLMDERHLNYPTEGVLQLQDFLVKEGYAVNHKRPIYVYPYLLRGRPNQVWQIDLTYIPMRKGFKYLVVYSRFVVNWDLSHSMESSLMFKALSGAITKQGKPEIVNSDQGSPFTSKEWIELLTSHGIQMSMDGKGRAIDNIYIERLWRTVKSRKNWSCDWGVPYTLLVQAVREQLGDRFLQSYIRDNIALSETQRFFMAKNFELVPLPELQEEITITKTDHHSTDTVKMYVEVPYELAQKVKDNVYARIKNRNTQSDLILLALQEFVDWWFSVASLVQICSRMYTLLAYISLPSGCISPFPIVP